MGAAPVTVCAHSGSAQRISRPTRRSYPTAASAAYSAVMKPPRSPLPAKSAAQSTRPSMVVLFMKPPFADAGRRKGRGADRRSWMEVGTRAAGVLPPTI